MTTFLAQSLVKFRKPLTETVPMKTAIIVYSLLVLASCVTPQQRAQQYRDQLTQKYAYQTIDAVIRDFGQPTAVTPLTDGGKVYEWRRDAGQAATAAAYYGTASVQAVNRYCIHRFTANKAHEITFVSFEGNACF